MGSSGELPSAGATDDIGHTAVDVVHPIKDLHTTILHLLGLAVVILLQRLGLRLEVVRIVQHGVEVQRQIALEQRQTPRGHRPANVWNPQCGVRTGRILPKRAHNPTCEE